MRKLVTGAVTTALLFGSVLPAFAYGRHSHRTPVQPDVAVVKDNTVLAVANSGLNEQTSSQPAEQTIDTGYAYAEGNQYIVANVDVCSSCQQPRAKKSIVKDNTVLAVANSGLNNQEVTGGQSRGHHHRGSNGSVTQTTTTEGADAFGTQWVVTNVDLGSTPELLE